MQFQTQPGDPIGDRCPGCGVPAVLVNEVSTYPLPLTGGHHRSVGYGSVMRIRTCAACQIQWETTSGSLPGDVEFLASVRSVQSTSQGSGYVSGSWTTLGSPATVPCTANFQIRLGGPSLFGSPVKEDPPGVLPELPAVQGAVIGYRAWAVDEETLQLKGTGGFGNPWEPGVNEATCHRGHLAPHSTCCCGMHALARFNPKNVWWAEHHVLGAVEAWSDPDEENRDRFFLHSDPGFRSQYSKVVLLAISDHFSTLKNDFIRKVLAPHYGADVCRREHLEDAAKEHGRLVPDELIALAVKPENQRRRALASRAKFLDGLLAHPSGFLVPPLWLEEAKEVEESRKATRKALSADAVTESLKRLLLEWE